jgi:hypothetical protein
LLSCSVYKRVKKQLQHCPQKIVGVETVAVLLSEQKG